MCRKKKSHKRIVKRQSTRPNLAENRNALKRRAGQVLQLDAVFCGEGLPTRGDRTEKRFLFKGVCYSGNPAADHLWVRASDVTFVGIECMEKGVRYRFTAKPYIYASEHRGVWLEKVSLENILVTGVHISREEREVAIAMRENIGA